MGAHYETGEPLPRNIFEMLKQKQQYQAGMVCLYVGGGGECIVYHSFESSDYLFNYLHVKDTETYA
jgi:hypothetical protein